MITTATLISGLSQGLIWAILTLGVYITFRILDIADLTVEGTFPLGAAVTAVLINSGMHPVLAVLMAIRESFTRFLKYRLFFPVY